MMLPCGDPRDARGMEAGLREISAEAGMPLILYLKSEDGFGSDQEQGLDAVGRLIDDGIALAIKYAVVRDNPREDAYLDGLLRRVDRARVISGMGERPAIEHLRDYRLGGLTTGSGCLAPRRCQELFEPNPFCLTLKIKYHSVAKHRQRHVAQIIQIRHRATIQRRTRFRTQHQILRRSRSGAPAHVLAYFR